MLVVIILFLIVVVLGSMVWAGISAAPYVPTFSKDIELGIKLADIKPGEIVYDLGCGDGRWLLKTAELTSAKKVIGLEISILPFIISWIRAKLSRHRSRISIKFQNFYQADLTDAKVVFCFLIPRVMGKVEDLLTKQLQPGSRLVSYCFKLPNKAITQTARASEKSLPVFFYRF